MSRRAVAVVVAVSCAVTGVLVSCSDDEGASADDPPVTTEATPSTVERATTTTTGDPFVVPATIDEPYVNRVLGALDKVVGEAGRILLRARQQTPEYQEWMAAAYDEPELADKLQLDRITIDQGFPNLKPEPGDERTTVKRLLSVRPDCMFVEVVVDAGAVVVNPVPPRADFLGLRPKSDNPGNRNPTPWAIVQSGTTVEGGPLENPCAG